MAGKSAKMNRRDFLGDGARLACAAGLAGVGLFALARQAQSLPTEAIRPPGAKGERDFLASCVRCGLCARDCPYDILKMADLGDGPANGTPYFNARTGPCEMCEDIPCVAACPTGALTKSLTDIAKSRMGTAVLLGRETCLNLKGLRCDVCYRVCPLIDKAIVLERRHNTRTGAHAILEPVVKPEACTGCGKCEQACVLEEAAIKVLPTRVAGVGHDAHYKFGWKEKDKTGKPLVPGIIDLPDRLPGGGS